MADELICATLVTTIICIILTLPLLEGENMKIERVVTIAGIWIIFAILFLLLWLGTI